MRCILVLTTFPDKMRPLMETSPVNGHFLSMYLPSIASFGVLNPRPTFLYHLFPAFPGILAPLRVAFLYLHGKGYTYFRRNRFRISQMKSQRCPMDTQESSASSRRERAFAAVEDFNQTQSMIAQNTNETYLISHMECKRTLG